MDNIIELAGNALKLRTYQHHINHEKGRWWTSNEILDDELERKVVLYRPTELSPVTPEVRRQILKYGDNWDINELPTSLSDTDRQRWEELNALVEPIECGLQACLFDIQLIPIAIEEEVREFVQQVCQPWDLAEDCAKLYKIDVWSYLIPLGLVMPSKRWIWKCHLVFVQD
jgi:hypothetical protein